MPERPGALAVAVEEHLDADHVRARHAASGVRSTRVGLVRARVARRGAPLHAAAVHEEPVAAVAPRPSRGRTRSRPRPRARAGRARRCWRACARRAARSSARGARSIRASGRGRRPAALGHADGAGRGLARGGLRRRRGSAAAFGFRALAAAVRLRLRPRGRLRGGRGAATEAATVAPRRLRKARRPPPARRFGHQRPPRGRMRSSGGCDRAAEPHLARAESASSAATAPRPRARGRCSRG